MKDKEIKMELDLKNIKDVLKKSLSESEEMPIGGARVGLLQGAILGVIKYLEINYPNE